MDVLQKSVEIPTDNVVAEIVFLRLAGLQSFNY